MTEQRHDAEVDAAEVDAAEVDAADPPAADPADGERPHIDVSGALGVGGHEEELLGTAAVPDTGGVLHHPHESDERTEAEERLRSAVVTRGISPVD